MGGPPMIISVEISLWTRPATAKLVYISKETHYSIEACCDESQIE